jgi:hypothetical protein
MVPGRISDKRIDDDRVVRRTQAVWVLPAPAMRRLAAAQAMTLSVDGRSHAVAASTHAAVRTLLESVRTPAIASSVYSPRMQLWIATFATFGIPGDSTMAEDVGTATEVLMMPDAGTAQPTRVANLMFVGTGAEAVPLLVQDDATGAAPIFGVNEKVNVVLPAARPGRRGVVTATVVARQRVEQLRDACQAMKVWTYLVSLAPKDLQLAQRGRLPVPRPAEAVDRWNGTAAREAVAARVTPAEQRALTASRAVVAQFVKEREAAGLEARDVQVLGTLPRNAGYLTNFGIVTRAGGAGWAFPTLTLRPKTCP